MTIDGANGKPVASEPSSNGAENVVAEPNNKPTYYGFDSNQVTKLIIQSLRELGYDQVAGNLEKESGLNIDTPLVREFRETILQGEWDRSEAILEGLQLQEGVSTNEIKFSIRRQQFLELLSEGKQEDAIQQLRTKLTPLDCNKDEVPILTKLVFYPADKITQEYIWDTNVQVSRQQLCNALEEFMSPDEVLPPHRLASLLEQSKQYQHQQNPYWLGDETLSLYTDLPVDRTNFPLTTERVLRAHTDEVWHVSFSHSGKLLATTSQDKTVRIWDTSTWECVKVLNGHTKGVVFAAWSPNDKLLISCGDDDAVLVWDVEDGHCIRNPKEHSTTVSSACWVNNEEFITTSLDKKMIWMNLEDEIVFEWNFKRIVGAALTPDKSMLVALSNDKTIHFICMETKQQLKETKLPNNLSHVTISKDSKYALVNVKPEELYLWNLETLRVEKKYVGNLHNRFVVRSCFGGLYENFVLSGSHDEYIYVWSRDSGVLLEALPGHSLAVNAVQWSPIDPRMFVSASDDHTIRVWRS